MEKKVNIIWSFSALEMLAEIHEYITEKSEQAADDYVDGIYKSIEKLEKHPESCAPCRNQKLHAVGYRCCLYKKHVVIYGFINGSIEILAVIHSSRNPSNLKDVL